MHSTTLIWSISSQNRLVFCEAVASKKATNLMKPIQLCKKQTRKTNKNQSSNDPLVAGGWFKNNLLEGIKNFTRKTCINICAIKSSISHVAIDMCMICGCEIIGYLKLPYVHVFFFAPKTGSWGYTNKLQTNANIIWLVGYFCPILHIYIYIYIPKICSVVSKYIIHGSSYKSKCFPKCSHINHSCPIVFHMRS